jgi:hypothetical protein
MSSVGYKFNVLWIDDQPSTVLADYALAAYGINIYSIENYSDGIKWLRENQNKCDAVILDVNCKHSRSEEIPSMKVFTNNLDQIKELCKGKRFIPWFVYTGGGYDGEAALEYAISGNSGWSKELFYKKPIHREKLLLNVVEAINSSTETGLREKYEAVFGLSDEIRSDLVSILSVLEKEDYTNTGIFNQVRLVMDWTMEYCHNLGLLQVERTGSNLSECSKFLGQPQLKEIIPVYIQRAIHTLVDISNEGSHRLLINEHVESGRAPYLIRSLIYELLNWLNWLKSLTNDPFDNARREIKVKELLQDNTQAPKSKEEGEEENVSFEGIVTADEKGNLYFENYVFPYNENGKSNAHLIGKRVHIHTIKPNSNPRHKSLYRYFVVKYRIVDNKQ